MVKLAIVRIIQILILTIILWFVLVFAIFPTPMFDGIQNFVGDPFLAPPALFFDYERIETIALVSLAIALPLSTAITFLVLPRLIQKIKVDLIFESRLFAKRSEISAKI